MADIIKVATRDAYGKALVELGEMNDKVIVVCLKKLSPKDFSMQVLPNVI